MDSVRSSQITYTTPPIQEESSPEIEEILRQAQDFAEGAYMYASALSRLDVMQAYLREVKRVLLEAEYQANPKAYLEAWKERRTTKTVLMMPQDAVLDFLQDYNNRIKFNCILL